MVAALTLFDRAFYAQRTCQSCSTVIGHCLMERHDPAQTFVVCGHCFRYGPPRGWPGIEEELRTDKGATSQAISGDPISAGPKTGR
jgi:hypothetical protein